jgi:hypothetical protein
MWTAWGGGPPTEWEEASTGIHPEIPELRWGILPPKSAFYSRDGEAEHE